MSASCFWCGEAYGLSLLDVAGREFQLSTCCDAALDEAVSALHDPSDASGAVRWLRAELRAVGVPARGIYDGGGYLLIDHGLRLAPVSFRQACSFIREHHAHHAPPAGWRFGLGCLNGELLVGVCMVGRTVCRYYPPDVVEVNRLCTRRDVPHALVRHAASKLYSAAAREARRRGFRAIITYILEEEEGTSLRAAGWFFDGDTRGGFWNNRFGRKVNVDTCGPKQRWARFLTKEKTRHGNG